MNFIKFDIVSDLHLEYWDENIKRSHYLGKISNYPFRFKKTDSEYLIIAGDICDNLQNSIDFLLNALKYYKIILYIDGNHEHFDKFPKLYDTKYINDLIKDERIIYLKEKSFIINKTAFIGCSGWWNYNNNDENLIKNLIDSKYMCNLKLNLDEKKELIYNIIDRSNEEFEFLSNELEKHQLNDEIDNIIVITHTIPNKKYGYKNKSDNYENNFPTQYNLNFEKLFNLKKISKWIFGHVHGTYNEKNNNIHYICNPRGGPNDFNRIDYNVLQISI